MSENEYKIGEEVPYKNMKEELVDPLLRPKLTFKKNEWICPWLLNTYRESGNEEMRKVDKRGRKHKMI